MSATNPRFLPSCETLEHMSLPGRDGLEAPSWEPDGPTLRFRELLKVTRVSRSKAYELIKSDPKFPKGIPLYDGFQSPKFYWTHEALKWVESRTAKYRSQGGV